MLCFFSSSLEKPSRTELQEILGRINGKINTIESIIAFYNLANAKLDGYSTQLDKRRENQTNDRNKYLNKFLQKELECTVYNMGIQGADRPCNEMASYSQNLTEYMAREADSIASVGEYNWAPANKATYIASLKNEKKDLERKRSLVLAALGKVDPLVGSILNTDPVTIAGIIDSRKEDSWLEFQFNSEDYKFSSSYKSSYSRVSASVRVGGWFWRAGYSYTRTTSRQTYESDMSQSSMKAKGKLLRVYIKRPWFKPEVFDDRNLEFVSCVMTILSIECVFTCYVYYVSACQYRQWWHSARFTWKGII